MLIVGGALLMGKIEKFGWWFIAIVFTLVALVIIYFQFKQRG